jgi:hypothetical protein
MSNETYVSKTNLYALDDCTPWIVWLERIEEAGIILSDYLTFDRKTWLIISRNRHLLRNYRIN